MSGRLLIVDSVATNRIVLKVKMSTAQYDVRATATCAEAAQMIASSLPDLILINMAGEIGASHDLCRNLRADPKTSHVAIISIAVDDTPSARFAALDAGVSDVLPRPTSDTLLLARVRSLLRQRNMANEWQLREGTERALGFEEEADGRIAPAGITILSDVRATGLHLTRLLQNGLEQKVRLIAPKAGLLHTPLQGQPDLLVIDGTQAELSEQYLFQMISDIKSRDGTREAATLVVVPSRRPDIAAMVLDLGADDLVEDCVDEAEMCLRARGLIARKFRHDRIRDRVRSGLHAAVTDGLTGLFNRRYAQTHLGRIAQQASESGRDYALMMCDIDHFKSINDRFGHSAGDAVLKELATRLKDDFREIDLVARIGGEEFLIAMPSTSWDEAQIAAERLRDMIALRPFTLPGPWPDLNVSISVGVAVAAPTEDEQDASLSSLFDRADAALYEAKASGRNAVFMAETAA